MDKYMKLKDIPKGQRWAHFKEYYKFQTFMAVFFGILLIILVKDMFFSEKYDITITEATTRYYSEEVTGAMDTMFTEHSRDYDGNNKRNVAVFHITFDTSVNEDIYEYLLGDEKVEDSYANLKEVVGGSVTPLLREGDEYRLYLKDIPAFQESETLQLISDDLFFIMRKEEHVNPKGKAKIAELYDRSVQMMESLAAGTAEPEVTK